MKSLAVIATALSVTLGSVVPAAIAQSAGESEQERLARRLNRELDASEAQRARALKNLQSKDDALEGLGERAARGFRERHGTNTPEFKAQMEEIKRQGEAFQAQIEAAKKKTPQELHAEAVKANQSALEQAREKAKPISSQPK